MNFQELIRACERSDRDAQHGLFDFFKDMMMGVCVRYSKDEEQANEILKEGFIAVFNNSKNFPGENQLENWIKNKMIDTAVEVVRRNRQEYKIVSTVNAYDNLNQQDKVDDDQVTRDMENSDVIKAIQALTPAYRVVINLHLIDGYSIKRISEKLDVGEATITMNFEKAMHQLRKNIVQLTTVSHGE